MLQALPQNWDVRMSAPSSHFLRTQPSLEVEVLQPHSRLYRTQRPHRPGLLGMEELTTTVEEIKLMETRW